MLTSFPSLLVSFSDFFAYNFTLLSTHHQSLESALRHPGDNRTQIRELGQTLIDGGILDELISEKLEAFNSRYEQLNHQVRTLSLCVSKCGMCACVCVEKRASIMCNIWISFSLNSTHFLLP